MGTPQTNLNTGPHSGLNASLKASQVGLAATASNRQPTFLMCPPTHYEVNYVINPWMSGNVHRSSRERAAQQWDQLHAALRQIAQVLLVEPQPGSPDMVFTANAGLVLGKKCVLSLSLIHISPARSST